MLITLIWTDVTGYEYNLAQARLDGKTIEVQIDIANSESTQPVAGKPLQVELLDGEKWELPVNYRLKQKFGTYPNMLIDGITFDGSIRGVTYNGVVPYKTVFEAWWYSVSHWITTDDFTDLKFVRSGDLAFEQVDGINFAERATFEIETAGVS